MELRTLEASLAVRLTQFGFRLKKTKLSLRQAMWVHSLKKAKTFSGVWLHLAPH